jgi:hypothetical protein
MVRTRIGAMLAAVVVIGGMALPLITPSAASPAGPTNATTPDTTPCTPSITSVDTFQAQSSQSVEIVGACFGTAEPLNQSGTFNLQILDRSRKHAWSACYLGLEDPVTCSVSSWTPRSPSRGSTGHMRLPDVLKSGDQLLVAVWNPQTLVGPTTYGTSVVGTSSHRARCVPTITSVGIFQPGPTQDVDIDESCLGTHTPYSSKNNPNLYIEDAPTSPAWSACNGGAVNDAVRCTISSWTNDQIVLSGFGSSCGFYVLNPGDQIIVAVLESSDVLGRALSSHPLPQAVTRVRVARTLERSREGRSVDHRSVVST